MSSDKVNSDKAASAGLLCPSAQPGMQHPEIIGVVTGSPTRPRLRYLRSPQPVTPEILAMAAPVQPTEVFRISAKCAGGDCRHFADGACHLVRRGIDVLPAAPADCQAGPVLS